MFTDVVIRRTIGALVASASFLAFAGPSASPLPTIAAVWDLSAQPCNGGGGNAMHRNPDQETIKQTGLVELRSLKSTFQVPSLPDLPSTYIKLYLGDRSRGVTDNYILLAEQDLAPPVGAVVITELPPDFNAEKAFAAVNTLERQLSTGSGVTLTFEKVTGPFGDAIELVVPNRIGTHCFPTSRFQFGQGDGTSKTVGISRFVFIKGRLVEFALILRVSLEMKPEDQKAYARRVMEGYWAGFASI